MADLKALSDDELLALKAQLTAPQAKPEEKEAPYALKDLSDEELFALRDELAPKSSGGILSTIGDGIVTVGNAVDSVTGAPTRAAIGAAQDGKNPFSAFASQFAEDPTKAPTGKQIVQKAGVSDKPIYDVSDDQFDMLMMNDPLAARDIQGFRGVSRSGAAGFAVDSAADPLNIVPAIPGAKMLAGIFGKGIVKSADLASDAAKATARAMPGGQKAINVANTVVQDSKAALSAIFKPKLADDYADMVKVAQKNGIDPKLLPESVEFGEGSFISRASRNMREGPLGQPDLERFEEGIRQVQGAYDNKVGQIAGGAPLSERQAGELIREGFDEGMERLFGQMEVTHDTVQQAFPGLAITPNAMSKIESKLNGIERFAKGRLERGIAGREEAEHLLQVTQAIRNSNGSYKQTVEALRDIGELAFKSNNYLAKTPVDVKKLRDLYGALNEALIDTVRETERLPAFAQKKGAVSIADQLTINNKAMSEYLTKKGHIAGVIGNKRAAPEEVFQNLILRGNSQEIDALKEFLSPEQLQQLKGAFLENLVRRNPDGAFSFKTLYSALRNKQNAVASLFTPQEIQEIGEIVRLGDRFGNPVLSTSGTGASNLFADIPKALGQGATNRAIIESMKEGARGRAALSPSQAAAQSLLPAPSSVSQNFTPKAGLPRRGRFELGLKGAQVLSVQPNTDEETAIQRRLRGK